MKVEDCTPGLGVVYSAPGQHAEDGVIVRVSADLSLVYVRYRGSETPKATRPDDLMPLAGKGTASAVRRSDERA